ncbi:type II toxin-antitoxin system VapC family toxin [Niabella drilacis]|uniref:PIN domain nuclease, a component of toxin-antitoxin system (PIN domain) n=1 Tax=Niabella drilacis (strain DSM 25811 / CCM 8410 / CCUG 62505 / LMG 26954 / E90) TaxID=1285928 RepID=A0A1G6T3A7_NIADE|nr:type II toxin-antitoxin system VapC family toxin [Niabella drilacis]SDD23344.1 PIN domain nuclease, a component of toxin-antitoxin system (PIN domain) [Niabella drilacis]
MTYLLDTHYILWAIAETKMIPARVKTVLTDPKNTILVSAISFWEIALKFRLGKLKLDGVRPEGIPLLCEQMGFVCIPLTAAVSSGYHQLTEDYHKDPFDRMLIWQAIVNNYILVSSDKEVKKYSHAGLKIL